MAASVSYRKTREKWAKFPENTKKQGKKNPNQNPLRFSYKLHSKYFSDSLSNHVCCFSDGHSSFTGVSYNGIYVFIASCMIIIS